MNVCFPKWNQWNALSGAGARCCGLIVLSLCLCVLPRTAAAAHEVHFYNDFSVTLNDVSGSGDDQSSLTQGSNALEVLTINGKGDFGDFDYRYSLGGKATDDPRNDVQKYSLTRLQGRVSNQIHTLTLGDTFQSFSQYSLSSAVKGASYRYANKQNMAPDVTLLYGLAYPRWDNFWGLEAVQRDVLGARVQQQVNDKFWIAGSYVKTNDDERVAGASLYDTDIFSIDWEYLPIPGLTITGESAFSDSEESVSDTAAKIDRNGSAHHLEAIGDGGPSRVVLDYERVSPDFLTLLGSATPDREKAKATWRYKYSKTLTMNFGMLWYRDNLNGDLTERTDHYRPEIGLSVKRFLSRRYAVADVTYKYDKASGATDSNDHFLNFGYRDRFGLWDSDTNFGIIFYDTDNSRDSDEFTYNTTLSTRQTVGKFVLKPSLRLGGWTLEDDLNDANDQIWEYSVGLGVDIPSIKVTSNFRIGQNKLIKDDGDDVSKVLVSLSAYYRPDFLSAFDYAQLYLRAYMNDFSYSTNARDFRENSATAGIIVRF